MRFRVPKFPLKSLFHSSLQTNLPQSPTIPLLHHFASIPDRGASRSETRDNRSGNILLDDLNLDDHDSDNGQAAPPHRPTPSSRPMRGDRKFIPSDNHPSSRKFESYRKSPNQESPIQRPLSRPMRGGETRNQHSDYDDLFFETLNTAHTAEEDEKLHTTPPYKAMGSQKEEDFPLGGLGVDDITGQNKQKILEGNSNHTTPPYKAMGSQKGEDFPLGGLGVDEITGQNKQKILQDNSNQIIDNEDPSHPQDADDIFKKMKETGLIPNAVAMLDGLCKDGLVQEAMKLFGLMREKGTIPEIVIYTAVVEAFCKAFRFEDAKRIFRKMQTNGISPNAFSYTVLVQGLCKGKEFEDAVMFCAEMLEAGHSPNVATFVGLVDGFCRYKGVEEAGSVLGRLREKGYAVDEKAVKEHLDKKGPFSPSIWEVIFGKKSSWKAL